MSVSIWKPSWWQLVVLRMWWLPSIVVTVTYTPSETRIIKRAIEAGLSNPWVTLGGFALGAVNPIATRIVGYVAAAVAVVYAIVSVAVRYGRGLVIKMTRYGSKDYFIAYPDW